MPTSKTHFAQVPVKFAEKVAEEQPTGRAAEVRKRPKTEPNGKARANPKQYKDPR